MADAERSEVGDQRGGVGEAEVAVQLHAVGRARNRDRRADARALAHRRHGRVRARVNRRSRLASRTARTLRQAPRERASGSRRHVVVDADGQLAPPVRMLVDRARQVRLLADERTRPRAAARRSPTASREERHDRLRELDAERSDDALGAAGRVSALAAPAPHQLRRDRCARSSRCAAAVLVAGDEAECLARTSISRPSHQPASVGRSCVLAVDERRWRIVDRRLEAPAASRSNISTRYDSTSCAASVSRTSSGTVPRSSPITMQRWRWLSSASRPTRSSSG